MNLYDEETINKIVNETDLEKKKSLMKSEIVANFEFKKKSDEFNRKIDTATSTFKLDKLLYDIVLKGEGHGVI